MLKCLVYWGSVRFFLSPVKLGIGGVQQISVSWDIYIYIYRPIKIHMGGSIV
jgi:hypothetical protein